MMAAKSIKAESHRKSICMLSRLTNSTQVGDEGGWVNCDTRFAFDRYLYGYVFFMESSTCCDPRRVEDFCDVKL